MRVFVAEKASLARAIADALAAHYSARVQSKENCYEVGGDVVAYCSGHILREAEPHDYDPAWERWDMRQLPMIPGEFKLLPDPTKKGLIRTIKEQVAAAAEVIHAGDADREGQAIVDNVLAHIGCRKPVKRIWMKELNVQGILRAMGAMKPNSAYRSLYDAAKARTEADWGIGMNCTRAYSLVFSEKTGLRGRDGTIHVGRVTTPTLGLVVARDLEIENFVPKDYYTLRIECRHANGNFWAKWQPPASAPYLDEEGRPKERKPVEAVAAKVLGRPGRVTGVKTEAKREPPPLPFSLSELQKAAGKFGLSPALTLECAQKLYETYKLTSYPRTDCPYLEEAQHREARDRLAAAAKNFAGVPGGWPFAGKPNFSVKSRAWNDSKLGAHSGIIPLAQHADLSRLTPNELLVYRLVVRNFLAQFYPDYAYESTIVGVQCEGEAFKAAGKVEKEAGWRVLFRAPGAKDDDDEESGPLPPMQAGDATTTVKAEVKDEKTKPPPRFDGASLIDAMKCAHRYVTDPEVKKRLRDTEGIGTEATRATIIEQLVKRGYIDEVRAGKKKHYVSTDKGRLTIRIVPPELAKVDLTAWFEGQLEKIVEGSLALDAFRGSLHRFETKLVADAKSGKAAAHMPTLAECAPKEVPRGRGGASRGTGDARGWATGRGNAAHAHGRRAAKRAAARGHAAPAAAGGPPCPKCGKPMSLRERKSDGNKFLGCTGYPECRHTQNVT
jgi:DNA topoisomerase-3